MLHALLSPLAQEFQLFNLVNYITFRTGAALMTALVVVFVIGPGFIRWARARQRGGQPIRDDGPETHIVAKAGTPTMGGGMILAGLMLGTLLWADLSNPYVWAVLGVTAGFGLLGFADDYLKVTKRTSRGVIGRWKLLYQFAVAFIAVYAMTAAGEAAGRENLSTALALPVFKDVLIQLGPFFIVFGGFVIVGASNAVNLTDGLDGLAIAPVMIAAGAFGIIAYLAGNAVFADYLQIQYVAGAGELAILCGAIIGAGLGFLWFNAPPAAIFMGDTGSLALGGALGATAVAAKHELVLAVVGGLFVLEALSVMIQVASFKLTGKRVFRMAPIHHHFEKKGWSEPTIVVRFWIIAVVLALIGLATLKIR